MIFDNLLLPALCGAGFVLALPLLIIRRNRQRSSVNVARIVTHAKRLAEPRNTMRRAGIMTRAMAAEAEQEQLREDAWRDTQVGRQTKWQNQPWRKQCNPPPEPSFIDSIDMGKIKY